MAKKVCRKCRIFVEKSDCPICKGQDFTESWKGKLVVINPEKSQVAKQLEITVKGDYALKT